jgi:LacI family transcriptional regulator
LAIGAYRAAAARGLEVPRDVSIVGFNDMPFVDQFRPPLTTVRIPHRELGRRAAGLLLAALDTASSGYVTPPSGIGREGGRWSRDFFTEPKAFVMRFP